MDRRVNNLAYDQNILKLILVQIQTFTYFSATLVCNPSLKTCQKSHFCVSKSIFQFSCFIKRFVKNTKSNFKLIYHTDWYWEPPLPEF